MPEKVGLIAGSGRFPILVAREARRLGVGIVPMGLQGITDPSLETVAGPVRYFKLGEIAKPIQFLKDSGASKAVMAGKVEHASLFGGVLPDWRAVKLLASLPDRRTDTILRAVAEEFAKEGIELLSSAAWLGHLLAPEGVMSRRKPSSREEKDLQLGWRAAKALSGLDIGQAVVVQEGSVVAVEAVEGTDAAIRRASRIIRDRGGETRLCVVKVAKPRQDFRFDLPVLGLDSLKVFAECGVAALAVEAGATLLFDREEFLKEADRLKIAIRGAKDIA